MQQVKEKLIRCPGCGTKISPKDAICPICRRDNSDDQTYEWGRYACGLLGGICGHFVVGGLGAVVGFFCLGYGLGAIFDFFLCPKKKKPQTEESKSV